MDEVRETRFENGLRLLVAGRPGETDAAIRVVVPYGYVHEPPERREMAHFLEHGFHSEVRNRDGDPNRHWGFLRASENATTYADGTVVDGLVPARFGPEMIQEYADCFATLRMAGAAFERERTVVVGELGLRRADPEWYIGRATLPAVFPGHILGQDDYESIRRITYKEAVAAKRRNHVPEGAAVVLVGAVTPEMERMVAETFGALPYQRREPFLVPPVERGPISLREERDVNVATVSLAWPVFGAERQEQMALEYIAHLLGSSREMTAEASRLYDAVRTRRGLAYGVDATFEQVSTAGYFSVLASGIPNKKVRTVVGLLEGAVNDIVRTRIGDDEFQMAQETMEIGERRVSHETASGFADHAAFCALRELSPEYHAFQAALAELTPGYVQAVARRFLSGPFATIAVVGPGAR